MSDVHTEVLVRQSHVALELNHALPEGSIGCEQHADESRSIPKQCVGSRKA